MPFGRIDLQGKEILNEMKGIVDEIYKTEKTVGKSMNRITKMIDKYPDLSSEFFWDLLSEKEGEYTIEELLSMAKINAMIASDTMKRILKERSAK